MDRAQPSPETEHIGAQGTLPAWVQDHHPLSSILYLVCLVVFTERQKPACGGLVAKSCPTLVTPWSLLGSSVHGIPQARILELVAISFSRGSSQSRNWTQASCIEGRFFTNWATREACIWILSKPVVSFLLILLAISILFDPGGHYRIFWDLLPAHLVFLTLIPLYLSLSFFPGSSSSLAYSLFFCPLLSTFYLLSPWERPQHSQQSKLSLSLILISKVSLFFQQPQVKS